MRMIRIGKKIYEKTGDALEVVALTRLPGCLFRLPGRRRRLVTAFGLLAGALLLVPMARAFSPLGGHGNHGSQGYLGINFRDVTDEQVTALKLKDTRGVEIIVVDHDGPGFQSGLREHDVIQQINGQAVEGEEQLRKVLRDIPAGKTVAFMISRDGQQQTLSAMLANRETIGRDAWDKHIKVREPQSESFWRGSGFFGGGGATSNDLPRHGFLGSTVLSSSYTGALLEMMGPQLADYFGTSSGLLVRAVDPNSPAAVAGMRAGDVVVKIDAIAVVSSADWLKTVHENRGKALSVVVLRDRKEQILTLTPDSKKRSSVAPQPWPGTNAPAEPVVGQNTPVASKFRVSAPEF